MARFFLGWGHGRRSAVIAAVALVCAVSASNLHAAVAETVVPHLSGSLDTTYARLHAAGLRVSVAGAWTFVAGAPPAVLRSLPAAGARVPQGTAVTLYLISAGRPPSSPARAGSPPRMPSFTGQRVSAAAAWASAHHVSFRAHLAPLRGGGAPWLLANYVVGAQAPRSARANRGSLTVWGRQPPPPAAAPAPPAPPPATPSPVPPPSSATTTTAPPPAAAADTTTPPPNTYYENPVYNGDFPDPFVLDNGDSHSDYWAFSTGDRFPVLHSSDLVHWTSEPTAMTSRPTWVPQGSNGWNPWAPSVIQLSPPCPSSGCYVMYYVGLDASVSANAGWGVNCIGVAAAVQPGGPYTDQGPLTLKGAAAGALPIGCGDTAGEGNIDPSPFIDVNSKTDQAYLYISTDRASVNGQMVRHATVSVIPLDPGLMQASGARVPLLTGAAGTWEDGGGSEGPTVEGPFMELRGSTYYLFYSGGNWGLAYGMGYATSNSPTGQFTKSPANPILAQTQTVLSPGGGDRLITGPHGGLWLAYHARAGSYSAPRTLRLDPFNWQPAASAGAPDVPVIAGPTTAQSAQP